MSHSFKIFIFLWVHLSLPFPLSKQLAIKDLVDYSLGRIMARHDISCHITRGITSIFTCDSSTFYILSEYFLSALSDYALRCWILKFSSSQPTYCLSRQICSSCLFSISEWLHHLNHLIIQAKIKPNLNFH